MPSCVALLNANGWSMIDIEHPCSFAALKTGIEFSQDLYRQGSKRDLRLVQPEGQPKLFDERVRSILPFPDHEIAILFRKTLF
jgi:hypothetical protein